MCSGCSDNNGSKILNGDVQERAILCNEQENELPEKNSNHYKVP